MVGIILASHGEFANGILQSGSMIFGEQENVKAVTLMPSEGPDDIKAKMQEAIATFDDQEEVLFLVDLWGGTPFNQANSLFEDHKDKWAIVAGMNLPMVIEAYASRFSMNTAHEIAAHIVETAWTKSVNPSRIIVVSDAVAKDDLRKKLIEQAAPPGVKANVIPVDKMIEVSKDPRFGNTKALLLFENPQDVLRAVEGGVDITEVNVGSMAHSVGKVVVSKVLSMGTDDVKTFEDLKGRGIKFDVRKVPNDSRDNMDEILRKAKNELANK